MMGSPEGVGQNNERLQREVTVPDFWMMRNEVTVEQYRACVNAGAFTALGCNEATEESADGQDWLSCNYAHNRETHPVNHVAWTQMRTFGTWVGADLPTEAQWEFAARSRGQNITYPWGNEAPNCDYADYLSCAERGTSAVCTHNPGNSAEGLCDLAGNL